MERIYAISDTDMADILIGLRCAISYMCQNDECEAEYRAVLDRLTYRKQRAQEMAQNVHSMPFTILLEDVVGSLCLQDSTWWHTIRTPAEWNLILSEELGAMAQAFNINDYLGAKIKIPQVMAILVRMFYATHTLHASAQAEERALEEDYVPFG